MMFFFGPLMAQPSHYDDVLDVITVSTVMTKKVSTVDTLFIQKLGALYIIYYFVGGGGSTHGYV